MPAVDLAQVWYTKYSINDSYYYYKLVAFNSTLLFLESDVLFILTLLDEIFK